MPLDNEEDRWENPPLSQKKSSSPKEKIRLIKRRES